MPLPFVNLSQVRRFPVIEPKYRGDWMNRCIAIGHAAFIGFVATRALLNEPPFSGYTQRLLAWGDCHGLNFFSGSSDVLALYLPFSMGYMLYDLSLMSIDSEVYTPLMVVHHVFSLTLWPIALLLQTHQFYVLQLMSTEVPRAHLKPLFLPSFLFISSCLRHLFCLDIDYLYRDQVDSSNIHLRLLFFCFSSRQY